MKYLLILLFTLLTIPALWAYGWGEQSSITNTVLKKDYCPKWDFTKSRHDNSCGVMNKAIIERAKIQVNRVLVKDKYTLIQLFKIQERAHNQTTENPYKKLILEYIVQRIADII